MALRLNKVSLFFFAFILFANLVFAQEGKETPAYPDYKDQEQHEKFYWRRNIVSSWQINQLKNGALVVRLKTNKLLIDALLKDGNRRMAEKKRMETLAINLNISRAYRKYYTFSSVYFIFSNTSDSLLNGARSNIFLDTNLLVDPSITMRESFYLLAESDYLYNSSIGFVPEDSARVQVEQGSQTNSASIVIKNKYGHQLKKPFPYFTYNKGPMLWIYHSKILIEGKIVDLDVEDNFGFYQNKNTYDYEGAPLELSIPKDFTYEMCVPHVLKLNSQFYSFYEKNPSPENNKRFSDTKPFLY